MDTIINEIFSHHKIISIIITVICGLIAYIIARFITRKFIMNILGRTKKGNISKKRLKTYATTTTSFLKYIIAIIVLLIILQILGVDISSMIAGLGVVGIIVGFALKDSLSDIIMGKNILTDNFFNVGDVIEFQGTGTEGQVIKIGLKRTQVKDLNNADIVTISNRNIENVQVRGEFYDTILSTPYEKTSEQMQPVLDDIITQLKALDKVKDATCRGIRQLNDSSVDYTIRVFCKPEDRFGLKYDINRILKDTMDKHHVPIPYKQIDIHSTK